MKHIIIYGAALLAAALTGRAARAGGESYPEALFYEKMRYLHDSQAVHAKNLSNADTPGYKAMGLEPFPAAPEEAVRMRLTSPAHIPSPPAPLYPAVMKPTRGEVKPNGNTVFPEDQLAAVNLEDLEQRTMTETARKFTGLRRAAWGDGR